MFKFLPPEEYRGANPANLYDQSLAQQLAAAGGHPATVLPVMDDLSAVPDGTVGLAVMVHVLDHLLDPVAMLEQIRAKLLPITKVSAEPIGDREKLEETFGLPVYQSYGFHEVQWVAIECPARQGLHVFEDAFLAEVVDKDGVPTGMLWPSSRSRSLATSDIAAGAGVSTQSVSPETTEATPWLPPL